MGCWKNFQQDALKIDTLGNLLNKYLLEVSPQKRELVQEEDRIQIILNDLITDIPLDKPSPIHLASYRDHRITGVQGSAVAKDLAVISHAIEVVRRERGVALTNNPVKEIRKPKLPKPKDRRFIEENNEQRSLFLALAAMSNRWTFHTAGFAIDTAMRRRKILSLNWENVNLEKRYVHLSDTKNDDSQNVPLSPEATRLMSNLSGAKVCNEFVFSIHPDALKTAWNRAWKRAGIEELRFHDLRHEVTSRFFEKGLNVMEVAAITGHKDQRMLQRNTHLRAEELARK